MSVSHKNHNPQTGPTAGIIGKFSVPKNKNIYHAQTLTSAHEKLPQNFSGFMLPRRLAPFLFLMLASAACIAAMFIVEPATPAPLLPPVQPYIAPVVTAAPPPSPIASEIEEVAKLLPEGVASALPIKPQKTTTMAVVRPHITITEPEPEAGVAQTARLMRSGIAAARAGQRTKALALLTEAQQLSPSDPRVLYNLAVLHDRMGNIAEATSYYQQLIAQPQSGQGINYRNVATRLTQLQAQEDDYGDIIAAEDE